MGRLGALGGGGDAWKNLNLRETGREGRRGEQLNIDKQQCESRSGAPPCLKFWRRDVDIDRNRFVHVLHDRQVV